MKLTFKSQFVLGVIATGISWHAAAADCSSATAWSSTTTYKGGELIVYQNNEYKARYWIDPGKTPNLTDPWDAWQFVQSCTTGTTSSASSKSQQSSSISSTAAGQQCNWYGNTYSICQGTSAGWGWENQQSCIAYADCSNQPKPYGVINAISSSVASSSVIKSSSSSSQATVSSTSSVSSVKSSSSSSSSSLSSKSSSSVKSSSISSSSQSSVSGVDSWVYDLSSATVVAPAQVVEGVGQLLGSGSSITWTVNAPVTGEYRVSLTWSSPYGTKTNSIIIDGTASSTTFDSVSPTVYTKSLTLTAGKHTFGFAVNSNDWGYMNVHGLKLDLLGGLDITSPANFAQLPSGSNIQVVYTKMGSGNLTYSVNDGSTTVYKGTSPLVIATQGDGIYRLKFGVEGTGLATNIRVSVGTTNLPTFVETSGTQFVLGNKPFYFNGSNQYYLMYKPEAMANDFFNRAKALNMQVVRTWMFCNDSSTHDGVCINMKSGDGFILSKPESQRTDAEKAIVKRSFELFDNYVAQAESHNIRLVLALADYWNYFGNIDSYGGYASASGRVVFKNFITNLLNHVNTITGVAYKDDPTIMMWELANEPRITSDLATFKDWVHDIAAHVKSTAPHQLISIGMESSFGFASSDSYASLVELNKDVNVNAISAHLYPTWWGMSDVQTLENIQKLADLAREVGKPAYIGEFGWPVNQQRKSDGTILTSSSFSDQAAVDAFVDVALQQRTSHLTSWYAKAFENRDAIGGMIIWQLSGLEWGNGMSPLRGCQWCAGPYGEPTGGWSANNDGFQFYCAITDSEYSITQLGAAGSNMEGNIIHMLLHKPSCDVVKQYSQKYQLLMQ